MSIDPAVLTSLPGQLSGLSDNVAATLAQMGRPDEFDTGDVVLVAGDPAERFHVVTQGRMHLSLSPIGRPPIILQSLSAGDLAGLSWYYPPHRWQWDVVAASATTTVSFDSGEMHGVCERHEEVELAMLRLLAYQMALRLTHSRLQLLDLYASPRAAR